MHRFINALVDNEIPSWLLPFWDDIKEEYFELSQNKSFSATAFLWRDISYLRNKLDIIQKTVDGLRLMKSEKLISVLRFYDFNFSFSDETYFNDLDSVIIRSQTESLELEQKQDEWEAMRKKNDGKPPTRDYFNGWFIAISDDAGPKGRTILPEDIYVAEYCRRCNNILEKIKQQQSKNLFGR